MIRLLLVDDHASFRQALPLAVEQEPDLTVVRQAESLADARHALTGIDIAVVDLDLPDGSGVELVKALRMVNPDGMVLILTASGDQGERAQAVAAGAVGVLHKSAGLDEIIAALRRLGEGKQLLS